AVPERLAFAPEGNEALLAHPREVLRQSRLRQAHGSGEGGYVALATFDELAQDHQPALVGERAQDAGDLNRLLLESCWIKRSGGHWPTHHPSVLRRADQHGELSGRRSDDEKGRHHRPGV